jgi:hypothetical protein
MLPFNLTETLKYGIIGFGAIMGILAFLLLTREQKKEIPNQKILNSIYIYMAFAIILLFIGILSDTLKANNKDKELTKEVEFKSGFSKNALNGTFVVTGVDVDFPSENFKIPRHKYGGDLEIREEGNQIIVEGVLNTYDALTDSLKGKGGAIFKSIGTINNNYVAGQYFYGTQKVNGFGTMILKFSNSTNEGKMYCLFRTTSGNADIGLAEMKLKRK